MPGPGSCVPSFPRAAGPADAALSPQERPAELRLLGGERRCVSGGCRGWITGRLPGLTPLSVPAGAVRAPLAGCAEQPAHCVCYGLGRFSGCPAARHQLAFLLLLLEELRVSTGNGNGTGTGGSRRLAPRPRPPVYHCRCPPSAAPCSTPRSPPRRRLHWNTWGCGCSRRMR